MEYIIISNNSKAFWNNMDGWVGWWGATIFTQEEREMFDLPCDGDWIPFQTQTARTVKDLQQILNQYPNYLQVRTMVDEQAAFEPANAKTPFRVSVAAVTQDGNEFCPLDSDDVEDHVVVIEVG